MSCSDLVKIPCKLLALVFIFKKILVSLLRYTSKSSKVGIAPAERMARAWITSREVVFYPTAMTRWSLLLLRTVDGLSASATEVGWSGTSTAEPAGLGFSGEVSREADLEFDSNFELIAFFEKSVRFYNP